MGKRAHGEGTITQRKDGTWMGQVSVGYKPDGSRNRRTVYGKTQKVVRTKIDELKRQITSGTFSDTRLTVKDYLRQWLEHTIPQLKPRSITDYTYQVEHYIIPRIGGVQLAKLTSLQIQNLVSDVARTSGARTANVCRSRLFTALKQAVRWQLIARNPVEAVDTVRETKREQIIWATDEAVKFLATARPHRLYALFYLAMATGLRHTELLLLRWEDIQGSTLHVKDSKTVKGVRRVALSPSALEALEEHRKLQEAEKTVLGALWADADLVFASEVGTRLIRRNVTRLRHRLEDEAKVRRATLHDLRHLNVSIRRKMGQDAKLIADQIGHNDPGFTTRLYTHMFEEERENSAVDLSQAFGSSTVEEEGGQDVQGEEELEEAA